MATQPKKNATKRTATKRTSPNGKAETAADVPSEPQFVRLNAEAVLNRYHAKMSTIVGEPTAKIVMEAAQMEAMGNGEVMPS